MTHDDASVCDLETVRRETERELLAEVLADSAVEEAYALQTCHRVEVYVVTGAADVGIEALDAIGFGPNDAHVMDHEESIRHLMRVAAGLESVVVGEDQIIGQVRDAYENASAVQATGPILDDAILKAIRVGERARTETKINDGVVSLGSAAVELADADVGLEDATATVVGMGEMGTLTTIALDRNGVADLSVVNRTRERAETNVDVHDIDATVLPLTSLDTVLPETDVLVTATGADAPVVDESMLAEAGDIYCIDLGQPPDIAAGATDFDNVTLRTLDDLDEVTEQTREQRAAAAKAVTAIIDEEFARLVEQFKRQRADEVIAAIYESADRIKRRELQTVLSKLDARGDLDADQREIVEAFAESLVSQLLSAPTRALRDAAEDDDWSTIATAIRLFDPDFDTEGEFPSQFLSERNGGESATQVATGDITED